MKSYVIFVERANHSFRSQIGKIHLSFSGSDRYECVSGFFLYLERLSTCEFIFSWHVMFNAVKLNGNVASIFPVPNK